MRRIESLEDEMNDVVTYELKNGQRVRLYGGAVREFGAVTLLRQLGYSRELPTERVPVRQDGQIVGTMAPDFDPLNIRSASFLYDPRPGDFVLKDGEWIATPKLGPGDLDAIPGFAWKRDSDGTEP